MSVQAYIVCIITNHAVITITQNKECKFKKIQGHSTKLYKMMMR